MPEMIGGMAQQAGRMCPLRGLVELVLQGMDEHAPLGDEQAQGDEKDTPPQAVS